MELSRDFVIIGTTAVLLVLLGSYSAQYHTDSGGSTATRGIFLKETIVLSHYQKIGYGDNFMCGERGHIKYSRSVTHQIVKVCR